MVYLYINRSLTVAALKIITDSNFVPSRDRQGAVGWTGALAPLGLLKKAHNAQAGLVSALN